MFPSISGKHQLLLSAILLLLGAQLIYGSGVAADSAQPTTYVTVDEVETEEYVSGYLISYDDLSNAQKERFDKASKGRVIVENPNKKVLPEDSVIKRNGQIYTIQSVTVWDNQNLILLSRVLGLVGGGIILSTFFLAADATDALN